VTEPTPAIGGTDLTEQGKDKACGVSDAASLYVHVPFCERKCLYCGFYSVARTQAVGSFIEALTREIDLRGERFGHATYETVFFGGGTPSLLAPTQVASILSHLQKAFRISAHAEITLEANPGTVSEDSLRAFRSLGINRLSLGIQSFHDSDLKLLGRIHDRAEALCSVAWSRRAGFENLNLDLIYAIPGQTPEQWEDNLRIATGLAPQHIAAYALSLEDATPLHRMARVGIVRRQATESEVHMFEQAMELLPARGYAQYEISNYARPGFRCRHNCGYWAHRPYLGLGPSAHSFQPNGTGGRRWWNVADLSLYLDRLERGLLPVASEEHIDTSALIQERILLGLRSSGLDLPRLNAEFGYSLECRQDELIRWMLAERLAVRDGGLLRLTSNGYVVCDEICARLSRDAGGAAPASLTSHRAN
jgi:oxygen-independent coproporphyrinogen-3 oxidase